MKDETKAAIFCLIWELFAYIGLFTYIFSGSSIGWYIFAIDTAVQITILYFDAQLESAKKAYKQAKHSLSKISAEYTQYIRVFARRFKYIGIDMIDAGSEFAFLFV